MDLVYCVDPGRPYTRRDPDHLDRPNSRRTALPIWHAALVGARAGLLGILAGSGPAAHEPRPQWRGRSGVLHVQCALDGIVSVRGNGDRRTTARSLVDLPR